VLFGLSAELIFTRSAFLPHGFELSLGGAAFIKDSPYFVGDACLGLLLEVQDVVHVKFRLTLRLFFDFGELLLARRTWHLDVVQDVL
jgi:hypothetical protein